MKTLEKTALSHQEALGHAKRQAHVGSKVYGGLGALAGAGMGMVGEYGARSLEKKSEFIPTHTTGTSRRTLGDDPKTGEVDKLGLPTGKEQNSDIKHNIISKMIRL